MLRAGPNGIDQSFLLQMRRVLVQNVSRYMTFLHWTKKWIYLKFAQHKDVANICLLLSKSVADMVNATFAAIFTLVRKYGSKCGIYHVCLRFALE